MKVDAQEYTDDIIGAEVDKIVAEQDKAIELLKSGKAISVNEEYGYRYWIWTPPSKFWDAEILNLYSMVYSPGNMPGEWMEVPFCGCDDIASRDDELEELFFKNEWMINVDDD